MSKKEIESTLNEVRILCSVDNEYVVGYMDAFLDKNDTELCIGKYPFKFSKNSHLNSNVNLKSWSSWVEEIFQIKFVS